MPDKKTLYKRGMSTELPPYGEFISRNIAAWRAMRRLKQSELAARMSALGFSWHQQTVGAVERGERRVTAEELLGLAEALRTTLAELIKPENRPEPTLVLPSGEQLWGSDVYGLLFTSNNGHVTWPDDGDEPEFRPGGYAIPPSATGGDR